MRQEVWSALHTDKVWSAATHMALAGRQLAYQGLLTEIWKGLTNYWGEHLGGGGSAKQSGAVRSSDLFFYSRYWRTAWTDKAPPRGIIGHIVIPLIIYRHTYHKSHHHITLSNGTQTNRAWSRTWQNIKWKNKSRNKKCTHSQNSITGDVALGFVMLVPFSP